MLKKLQTPFAKTYLIGVLGGLLGALIGAGIGYFTAQVNGLSGWSRILGSLRGAISGCGFGVGLVVFFRHARQHPLAKTYLIGMLGGLLGALIGAGVGYLVAQKNDPSGWSNLPNALGGAIYGYGLGVGAGVFLLHRKTNAPSAFSRSFLGSLAGLFFVIFFSAPLHLDFFPPLMWSLLILLPPLIAARLNNPPKKNADEPSA